MSPDDQLSAFLGETPQQSRADVFTAEVMKRVERQAFVARLAAMAMWALAGGLVLWGCSPALNLMVAALAPSLAPIAAVLAVVGAVLAAGGPSVWRRLGWAEG